MRYLVLFLLCIPPSLQAQRIIPEPVQQKVSEGNGYFLPQFFYPADTFMQTERHVFNQFMQAIGYDTLKNTSTPSDCIVLKLNTQMADEAYHLRTAENQVVEVEGSRSGIFYGLMTLLQWEFNCHNTKDYQLSELFDQPAFVWRGLHLDVSRHFFPVSFVRKYIDMMALLKLNTFHWHLTDDQGWRIEIKKYPQLCAIGSKRSETMVAKNFNPFVGDGIPHEGYYTQDEIRAMVRYAAERHIQIVPEIEMPGHSQAAIAAYPFLSCRKAKIPVCTRWGEGDDVFCTSDSTIAFLKDVLDEVLALFPSPYIHIGGDEVQKNRWKECTVCQENKRKNHLHSEEELQSYFIHQFDDYLQSKGRKMIGWDEILEGGLAPNAVVMSWRGEEGGIAAAAQNHQVVMSPGSHCYFDHFQGSPRTEPLAIGGFTPIQKVLQYEPVPAAMNAGNRKYVLGAQANVWTEYMASENHVEYMVLPRLLALSEVLWSGEKRSTWDDFKKKLPLAMDFFKVLNYQVSESVYDVNESHTAADGKIQVQLQDEFKNGEIRYWFHDKDSAHANIYSGTPITLETDTTLHAAFYEHLQPHGHTFCQKYYVNDALGNVKSMDPLPDKAYSKGGASTLCDGVRGGIPRISSEWLGWKENSPQLILDLQEEKSRNRVALTLLSDKGSWIYIPALIRLSGSRNGKTYEPIQQIVLDPVKEDYLTVKQVEIPLSSTSYRYLKLNFTPLDRIPVSFPGEGKSPWLFISEVDVR